MASSSPPELIRVVLAAAGLTARFRVTVSSEEVPRGKPAPDVYHAAATKLGAEPATCVAVEDSANGLRAAAAAGMVLVAVPNPHFPPPAGRARAGPGERPHPGRAHPRADPRAARVARPGVSRRTGVRRRGTGRP